MNAKNTALSPVEKIKSESSFLRGSLEESLADSASGALVDTDTQLSKFHGIYQQDDRDERDERRRRMLEPDYQFMIRARVPAGIITPQQWLVLDDISRRWANGSLRLTTRQAIQYHGVLKKDLRGTIRKINSTLLDTFAACGDVNRNVMSSPLPEQSLLHRQVADCATRLSTHLTPATRAYHDIWLKDDAGKRHAVIMEQETNGSGDDDDSNESEPIYGPTYLPRKFKIGFAVPPRNDVDVFSQDLGFIAIAGEHGLEGFNVVAGGGMGTTHGDHRTYPRLGTIIGFCTPQQVNDVAEAVVKVQRDHGNRSDRKQARLKYTIDRLGPEQFVDKVAARLDFSLQAARRQDLTHSGDRYGWHRDSDGLWHLVLFVENGRLADLPGKLQLSGMRAIAELGIGEIRLTPNQNLVVSRIRPGDRGRIDRLVSKHGLDEFSRVSPLRLNAMACVGFPTCALAMAESERYLPGLVTRIEKLMERHELAHESIILRVTGCPNGCARPFLAEIGLVGKGPGRYNLHLGASPDGSRLNRRVLENADEEAILATLDNLFADWARRKTQDESFGDFVQRTHPVFDVNGEAA